MVHGAFLYLGSSFLELYFTICISPTLWCPSLTSFLPSLPPFLPSLGTFRKIFCISFACLLWLPCSPILLNYFLVFILLWFLTLTSIFYVPFSIFYSLFSFFQFCLCFSDSLLSYIFLNSSSLYFTASCVLSPPSLFLIFVLSALPPERRSLHEIVLIYGRIFDNTFPLTCGIIIFWKVFFSCCKYCFSFPLYFFRCHCINALPVIFLLITITRSGFSWNKDFTFWWNYVYSCSDCFFEPQQANRTSYNKPRSPTLQTSWCQQETRVLHHRVSLSPWGVCICWHSLGTLKAFHYSFPVTLHVLSPKSALPGVDLTNV